MTVGSLCYVITLHSRQVLCYNVLVPRDSELVQYCAGVVVNYHTSTILHYHARGGGIEEPARKIEGGGGKPRHYARGVNASPYPRSTPKLLVVFLNYND